jgi:lipoprotein-releasing system permease protein
MPIIEAIKADDRIYGIAPKVTTQVFFNAGNIEINGVVNGIDIIAEDKLFAFNNYMVEGNSMDLVTTNNSIILGKGVADKMLVNIGDMIQITTAKGDMLSMKVVGIFQSGLADFDNTQSYASLATTQKLLGKTNSYITDIQVKLKDIALAPEMAKEYQQLFQVEAIDIQTANSQFETGTKVRNIITYVVSIALLVVAGFGIYNILNMMIYEKMDDIAILKATGFSGKDVMYIFMSQALIIGLIGGVLGLIFGQIFTQVISQIPFETPSLPTIKTYPVHQDIKYYYIGIAFALTTTFVAGLFPARKASKIDPVEIIRGK